MTHPPGSLRPADILAWVRARGPEILGLVETFIGFPSENTPPTGQERAFQEHLAGVLRASGLTVYQSLPSDCEALATHPRTWPGRDYTDRPNVVGVLPGAGGGRSLLLGGHGDVVPGVPGQHDPFQPTRQGDRIIGRGACDMKAGLAAGVAAIRCLSDLGVGLDGDLLFESVVDEEMAGGNGTLASRLMGHHADAAVIMEPTGMAICPSHIGGAVYRVRIQGRGGMGFGAEELISPAHAMGRLLNALESIPSDTTDPGVGEAGPLTRIMVSSARSGSFGPGQATGVPHDAVLELWIETSIGPTEAEVDGAVDALVGRLVADDALLARCEVDLERVTRVIPGSAIEPDHPLVEVARRAMSSVRGVERVMVRPADFACDAFLFHEAGIPAILIGPTGGNAHGPDEFVLTDSVLDLTATLAIMAAAWCGTHDLDWGSAA